MVIDSPVGPLTIVAGAGALHAIRFGRSDGVAATRDCAAAAAQLDEYFAGERERFDLELAPGSGSAWERRVWDELARIPFGVTATYGEVATRLGEPGKARAVGWANGRNPIPIVVPCHRVIGAGGKLTGYAGGLDAKRGLLRHEGALLL